VTRFLGEAEERRIRLTIARTNPPALRMRNAPPEFVVRAAERRANSTLGDAFRKQRARRVVRGIEFR